MRTLLVVCLSVFAASAARAQTATVTLSCPSGPPIVVVDGGADGGIPVVDAGPPPVVDAGTPPPTTSRPPASKGVGFYVIGRELYDANGIAFRIRGTNKTHQDNPAPGLGHTASNTTRWLVYFSNDPERTIADLQSPTIGGSTTFGHAVAVPGYWDGTCKSDMGTFNTMVNRWVRDAKKYQTIERMMILNIANEWGDDHRAWRDAYVGAIPKIRAAGWHGAIMVDAPGCGQKANAIVSYGAAILAADPEQNVVFDFHIYGGFYDSRGGIAQEWGDQLDLVPTFDALQATGLTVIVGEFGPGRNVGPSPTMISAERVIDVAEAHGMGWLSWSWDDNDLADAKCSNNWFCHVFDTVSPSVAASNLTSFGAVMVDRWRALAHPATVFPAAVRSIAWPYWLALVLLVGLVVLIVWIVRRRKPPPPPAPAP